MKTIRKYIAVIMTALMLICSKPVYAQEPMFGSSTIEYTVDDSFMVYVPETLTIDTEAYIYGDQINIDPAKSVYVHISGFDDSDGVFIHNIHDPNASLKVHFRNSEGVALASTNTLIGTFTESSTSISFTPYIDSYDQTQKAGKYTGVVYFDIFCE